MTAARKARNTFLGNFPRVVLFGMKYKIQNFYVIFFKQRGMSNRACPFSNCLINNLFLDISMTFHDIFTTFLDIFMGFLDTNGSSLDIPLISTLFIIITQKIQQPLPLLDYILIRSSCICKQTYNNSRHCFL